MSNGKVCRRRASAGQRNAYAGRGAEACVARHYADQGLTLRDRRWRGAAGEIDLIAQDGEDLVIVEVKHARTFERAAERLLHRQITRICAAASEYLGSMPLGQRTSVRFDLALVDGQGDVSVIENAFGA